MIGSQELFYILITSIIITITPIYAELILYSSILQLIEMYINSFELFLLKFFIYKTNSSSIINLNRRRGLRVIEEFENLLKRKSFFCILKVEIISIQRLTALHSSEYHRECQQLYQVWLQMDLYHNQKGNNVLQYSFILLGEINRIY